MNWSDSNLVKTLQKGGVVVMPTDTIYGVCARALDENAVENVYNVRQRAPEKPCIILISSERELKNFSIELSSEQEKEIGGYWPGPVSIIFDCPLEKFAYLHRGTNSLAFRIPEPEDLRALLTLSGPLVAPSANIEGQPPSKNIDEAKKYFGDLVGYYADGGYVNGNPSRVIKLHKDGTVSILR